MRERPPLPRIQFDLSAGSRPVGQSASPAQDSLVTTPVGPLSGQLDNHAAGSLDYRGGYLDRATAPRSRPSTTPFGWDQIGVPQSIQQVDGCGMQQQTPEVGQESMTGQSIKMQAVLQFIHPLFATATLDILVVDALSIP